MPDTLSKKINPTLIGQKKQTNYYDTDIVIIDEMKELPHDVPLQVDMIIVFICQQGRAQVDINGKSHSVVAGEMLVCPPNVYLDNYMASPDFVCKIFGLSYSSLQSMLHVNREIWELLMSVAQSPVFKIDDEMRQLMTYYYQLLHFKLNREEGPYRRQAIHALFQAIFYDLCDIVRKRTTHTNTMTNMKRGDLLVKRFLKMLADVHGEQRNVGYFASQLCVSTKYLSTMCKKSTGRTAKEWINEYTVEILRQQLRYSDLSVKEISNAMGFSNLSVFGKFVKATLGMSPTKYRTSFHDR